MATFPDAMIAAPLDPAAYPHPATVVDYLETHISHVFLAGDYAYKLKKPVDFGFLDFTTADKRRAACLEEVRLNRRLAPDIYLGVVSVCRGTAGFRIVAGTCAAGDTLAEVAVQMRRMPQDGLLDRLARNGRLEVAHLIDVARQVAAFHARTERGPDIERFGALDRIRAPAIQNFEQTAPYIGRAVSADRHRSLRAATEAFLDRHADRFGARVRARRIVDGHGDLHLRNMCLMDGRVVIFDCIEFNPALRAGDAMSDIAFLTMDLDHRGLPAHANRFLNEYLEQTDDYAGLPLLDYYQAYRACVRAKVSCFEIEQDAAMAREAQRYFDLAARYFEPRRGGILITCGVSGSGKSTIAREAATMLNGVIVRSDAVRKHLAGLPLLARGDEALYTPAMTERTYSTLRRHAREIVTSGRWAIIDAVHGRRTERAAAAELARDLGVSLGILLCEAPRDELVRRLARRHAGGRDVSDADVAVLDRQLQFFETPAGEEGPLQRWHGGALPTDWLADLARS